APIARIEAMGRAAVLRKSPALSNRPEKRNSAMLTATTPIASKRCTIEALGQRTPSLHARSPRIRTRQEPGSFMPLRHSQSGHILVRHSHGVFRLTHRFDSQRTRV